jgi:hypothetical protein
MENDARTPAVQPDTAHYETIEVQRDAAIVFPPWLVVIASDE